MVSVLEELLVADAEDWRAWLDRHHGESPGVWLVLAKKGKTDPTALTYDEALLEALCYGWIDGQVRRRDGESYRQRFTPRRQRSIWSARNVALAERLLAEGRMRPAGKAAIERAHNDGSWEKACAGPGTRAETRSRRLQQYVAMLARGESIYPRSRVSHLHRRRRRSSGLDVQHGDHV
jgi:uncharacterized protein YdeI (YjbR/CyaY-like superfamily)